MCASCGTKYFDKKGDMKNCPNCQASQEHMMEDESMSEDMNDSDMD